MIRTLSRYVGPAAVAATALGGAWLLCQMAALFVAVQALGTVVAVTLG